MTHDLGACYPTNVKLYTYTVIIHPAEPNETGYWVEVPALPGCFTQGETFEEAVAHAQEAIEGHLEALAKAGEPIPEEPVPATPVESRLIVRAPLAV